MWFKQFKAVFKNSFKVCSGDAFFLVINLSLIVMMLLAASMPSLGESEHLRLIRDQTHSLTFICGALAVSFGLIRVVCDDLRRGAGAILMSRPLSGSVLLSGKLFGVIACCGLLLITASSSYLWISEIAHHNESLEITSLYCFVIAAMAALIIGAGRQYLYGNNFSQVSSISLCLSMTLGLALRCCFADLQDFDFAGLQSLLLIFMALVVFASIILVIAVIADAPLVLGSSIILFFFGLLSEYLFGKVIGGNAGEALLAILPNWQMFWVLETLGVGRTIPMSYYFQCFIQAGLFAGCYLIISVILFERIEIKGVT
ncbi:MAG: hypothetical protein HRT88_04060 [Lentisphaeraceae bacterium]|nr:hypothetical protein [Lentisphaeraceae bacterium]